MIESEPLNRDRIPVTSPESAVSTRRALSMPTLDAQGLASSVGEAQDRPSATRMWEIPVSSETAGLNLS
jgi:hypothetical protein